MMYKRGSLVKNKFGNVGYVHTVATGRFNTTRGVCWQFANGYYLGLGEFKTTEDVSDLEHVSIELHSKPLFNLERHDNHEKLFCY